MIWCKERVGVKEESYRAEKRWLGRPGAYLHSPKDCSYLSSLFAAFFSGYSHSHAHTHTRTHTNTQFCQNIFERKTLSPFSLSLYFTHTHIHTLTHSLSMWDTYTRQNLFFEEEALLCRYTWDGAL